MSDHSVAEARNHLSKLIDQALAGEPVTITRHGRRVVELRPVEQVGHKVTKAEVEWLRRHRVKGKPSGEDAGAFVSRMRDEDWA